jgi:predicted PurR-regulated permease PerM
MSNKNLGTKFVLKSIESYVKTALVFLIIYACFKIFSPFLLPVAWGIIIAVAIYPLHVKLTKVVKKASLSSTIITLVFLALIIIPSISFTSALVDNVKELSTGIKEGTLVVPAPSDKVAEWPLIGEKAHAAWQAFSDNMTVALEKYNEQIKSMGEKFVDTLKSFAGSLLVFILSIIIAGIFLTNSKGSLSFANILFTALIGEKGPEMVENSKKTIKSVVSGVLGTAVIQTAIIAIALFVFKVPGAPIITLIVLFFAIAQLPPTLIIIPVIIYMFSVLSGMQATIFAVWAFVGSISDTFIKPMLLGRGLKIPMLIILIGAIGGMIAMGIIGLFIGAVIMALGYQLFQLWIEETKEELDENTEKDS